MQDSTKRSGIAGRPAAGRVVTGKEVLMDLATAPEVMRSYFEKHGKCSARIEELERQRDELAAAIRLGEGFHTDGPTLLEKVANFLEAIKYTSGHRLADELRRKATLERQALAALDQEDT